MLFPMTDIVGRPIIRTSKFSGPPSFHKSSLCAPSARYKFLTALHHFTNSLRCACCQHSTNSWQRYAILPRRLVSSIICPSPLVLLDLNLIQSCTNSRRLLKITGSIIHEKLQRNFNLRLQSPSQFRHSFNIFFYFQCVLCSLYN